MADIKEARGNYPEAMIMVHPECPSEVQDAADFVVSTSGMLKAAKESSANQFVIGTEGDMIHRLKKENPNKEFYLLGNRKNCVDMKKTTLNELYEALRKKQYEISLGEEVIHKASKALEEMIKYV